MFGIENVYIYLALCAGLILWLKLRSRKVIQRISDRRVFITGCDSGFGKLLAENLDKMGVFVYAGCLKEESAKELERCSSRKLKAIQVDITKTEDVVRAADIVRKDLIANSTALWAIVNNAGITVPTYAFEWHTKQDYKKVFDVNLFGTVDVTLKFLPLLKMGGEGRIVNVSSLSGRITPFSIPYSASKFATEGFSDGLMFELVPFNITTHVIEPSFFRTELLDSPKQINGCKKRFDEQTDEIKKSYGTSYLNKKIEAIERTMGELASPDIHLVPEAIIHALFDAHPRGRYAVGADARFLFIPLSFLPTSFQIWAIRQVRRLRKMPVAQPEQAVQAS